MPSPHAEARRGDIQRAMVWMLLTKVQDVAIYGYEEIREYPKINDVQNHIFSCNRIPCR